jgi:protein-tyrosine phosphatase
MQPSVYPIPLDLRGRLWIMPKPSSDWLADDIAAYRAMGMDKVISLMMRDEMEELGLADEAEHCRNHGMEFLQHPIPDRGLPDQHAFAALTQGILGELQAGKAVGSHCRGGIGRAGMLACCILTLHGLPAEEALALVSKARRVAVPDTDAQAAFIRGVLARTRPASETI